MKIRSKKLGQSRAPRLKKIRLENNQPRFSLVMTGRIIRYGLRNFARNAWLTIAATLVMVITLTIIFATFVASSVLNETIISQKAKIDVSVYIKSDANHDILRNLAGKLKLNSNVAGVAISDSASEYAKASKENSEAWSLVVEQGIKPNFPSVIHIKLHDMNKRAELDNVIKNDPQFAEWIDTTVSNASDTTTRQNTIDRLADIMAKASRVGIFAGVFFVAISILIVFNTIRMTIFSRREEIDMMKSIGADSHFIRGPFLVEAQLYGAISGVLATIIGYFAAGQLLPRLSGYLDVAHTSALLQHSWWLIALIAILFGLSIGAISARLALQRYLRNTKFTR